MHNLEEDLLQREDEIDFLISYLTNRYDKSKDTSFENKSFVLNINASWGSGKTYFLKSLSNKLQEQNYSVVEFDAWKNDYTKEPLLAFMSELNNSLESFFTPRQKKAKGFLKNLRQTSLPILMSILAKKLTGYTLDELLEEQDSIDVEEDTKDDITEGVGKLTSKITNHALKEHEDIKQSIKDFKTNMLKLLKYISKLKNKKLPMFILIDELDRCRPNYAIELLENIKHLFDIEGLYFIIATDSTQLSHSINAVYGNKFASEKYLKRFFDQEYKLKTPSNYEYINSLFKKYNLLDDEILFSPLEEEFYKEVNTKVKLFELFVELFDLKPRDINQVMISLHAIRITYNLKLKIHLPYLLFLIMLKHSDNNRYKEFLEIINKRVDIKIFEEFMLEINKNHIKIKIYTKKTVEDTSSDISISLIHILEKYIEFYNMIKYSFDGKQKQYRIHKSIYEKQNQHNIDRSIYRQIRKEVPNHIPDEKIDISTFNYPNLVEHTGQLS